MSERKKYEIYDNKAFFENFGIAISAGLNCRVELALKDHKTFKKKI